MTFFEAKKSNSLNALSFPVQIITQVKTWAEYNFTHF